MKFRYHRNLSRNSVTKTLMSNIGLHLKNHQLLEYDMSDESSTQNQLMELANKSSRSTVAVIDAMTQRGAFKGEELSTIGGLRDQCIQIIQICETLAQDAAMED